MVTTAFVLAGGLGTRLSSVVSSVPKPMAPVAGRPFLEHLMDYLCGQGFVHVVLCVGYGRKSIQAHFGESYKDLAVSYSVETEASGTGGALSQALEAFPQSAHFLVCNGDTLFPIDTSRLVDALGCRAWALAAFYTVERGRYGALSTWPDGQLRSFQEDVPTASLPDGGSVHANSGVWVGNAELIELPLIAREADYSREAYLQQSLDRGVLTASVESFECDFIDIGLPADYSRAQTMRLFTG